ncbi:signal transduction histidine kinase/ligand-binding sensor domain-containing protein [Duganella sp. 1224]|uniref:sensor histidine kinase n=1 Tax=Duganella sp. 1224 TaxID=2587052 RepID=UPI0015CC9F85|nr:sensor histidine kinase [Duganella sp. 1224]NYE59457.1 signal transduction histidine kinase/ligand-binding sensor domain-containing protein [Duganella sp. 1224]
MTIRWPASALALLWCALCCCAGAARAQTAPLPAINLHHSSWTARDGAPAMVLSMAQGADGWLWLASPTGLYRFDGVQFEQFTPANGPLLSRNVSVVSAGDDGALWIGYRSGGVSRLHNGHVRNYGQQDGLPKRAVWGVERDGGGRVWAATALGMYYLDRERWQAAAPSWDLPAGLYKTLMRDRHGVLWAQGDAGVYFLPQKASRFTRAEVDSGAGVLFDLGGDGVVSWNAAQARFHRLDGRPRPALAQLWQRMGDPSSLLFDRHQGLWIGLQEGVEYRGAHGRGYTTIAHGLSGRYVTALFEDQEGNVWAATSGGIDRFSRRRVTRIEIPAADISGALLADERGGVWLGRLHLGAGDDGQIRITPLWPATQQGWASVLYSYTRGADGVLWGATYRALRRIQGRQVRDIALPPEATGVVMPLLAADRDGSLLVSLRQHGMYRLRPPDDWHKIHPLTGVLCLARSDAAGLWLTNEDGSATHADGATWRRYGAAEGLALGLLLGLHLHGPHVWVGGETGVALLAGERFRPLRGVGGEAFEGTSGIVEQDDGAVWLNATAGLFRIPAAEVARFRQAPDYPVRYERLDQLDGLEGLAPRRPSTQSLARAADGRLWVVRSAGLYLLDPAARLPAAPALPVIIKTAGAPGAGVAAVVPARFAAGTASLQIDYTVPALAMPERVRFRYRLDDGDWQEVGGRRSAYFSNLGAGDYRFEVAASDYLGNWPDGASVLRFSIAPSPTETWWFRALCAAALLAAAWLAYRWHIGRVRRQLAGRLQERVGERERIARELHDTLLQSVQGLILHVHAAAVRLPDNDSTRQALESALRQADDVVDEGRGRIRDLRGEDAGKLSFADAVLAAATRLRAYDGPPVQLRIEGTARPLDPTMQEEALAIISEAIGNAYRHAGARSIVVVLHYGIRELRCTVRDDGAGIPLEIVRDGGRANHWGMRGMHERAGRIKARLALRSGADGTEWQLALPAALAYTR